MTLENLDLDLKNIPTFGVAGNFTGHLEQAGEAFDFKNVKTAEVNAPKAIFPTYLPKSDGAEILSQEDENYGRTPDFLHIFPFNKDTIIFPAGEEKLQIEPECALIFDAEWAGERLINLMPIVFGASNDCSIRKQGAKKISEKKNWGSASKGFAQNLIKVSSFSVGSILDKYRIASFLIRDGIAHQYGEDSAVRDYSYIYEKLIGWMLDKFNNQKDAGPAEDIHSYLLESDRPSHIMVSIGATRYTDWGEHNFLQNGDDAVVVVYPEDKYNFQQIKTIVESGNCTDQEISILKQTVKL